MILDYDRAFREQYQFLPPADALNAEVDRSQLAILKKFGDAIHDELGVELQEKEEELEKTQSDLEEAKGALEELKRNIIRELDADIPNLSDICKLCED